MPQRSSRLLALLCVLALAAAACSDGSSDAAGDESTPNDTTSDDAGGDDSTADDGGSADSGSDDSAADAPNDAAVEGDGAAADVDPADWPHTFVADQVGGGQIDAGDLAGQDLVLWFWAPW